MASCNLVLPYSSRGVDAAIGLPIGIIIILFIFLMVLHLQRKWTRDLGGPHAPVPSAPIPGECSCIASAALHATY